MDYFLLIAAAILLSINFVINKIYQKEYGDSVRSSLKFNTITAFFTAVIFFGLNGFQFEINPYSVCMGSIMGLCVVAYTMIGFKIIKKGYVSLYTLFLMTGGMVIPYVWGVFFLNETIDLLRIFGLLIIVASVLIANSNIRKAERNLLWMCVAVFILNGLVSVTSKMHQINSSAISSEGFVLLSGIIRFVCCLIVLAAANKKLPPEKITDTKEKKTLWVGILMIFASALVSGVSYLFQLIGAKEIQATVLYPIITGGSVFFTTIAAWIVFKEKPTKKLVLSVILCFVGTCMFL